MFVQTFKNIDDILHKDAGCSSEHGYVEQASWVLFLRYLDSLPAWMKRLEAIYHQKIASLDDSPESIFLFDGYLMKQAVFTQTSLIINPFLFDERS